MKTYIFTKTASGFDMTVDGSELSFTDDVAIAGSVGGNVVGLNIEGLIYHLNAATDSITVDGEEFTGTAQELRDFLDTAIFVNSGGTGEGGEVDLSNYYTKSQVDNLLDDKADDFATDAAPANGSANPVQSGGVFSALAGKADKDSQSAITYASTVTLDFSQADPVRTLALTGNVTFAAASNKGAAKSKVVIIVADGYTRTLAFPAQWVFLGAAAPAGIAAGKTAVLSLYCKGANETDVLATYTVQP